MSSFAVSVNVMFANPLNSLGEERDGVAFALGLRDVLMIERFSFVLLFERLFGSLSVDAPTAESASIANTALGNVSAG